MRVLTAATISLVAGAGAYSMHAFPQFLGALLGAFVAGIVRNDRERIKVIVSDALDRHVIKFHKGVN